MKNKNFLTYFLLLSIASAGHSERILHIPMDLKTGGLLEEKASGKKLAVNGSRDPENLPGAKGQALRLDGFSSFAKGNAASDLDLQKATFGLWVAPETYPIVKHDTPDRGRILMGGTLSNSAKKGWGFTLGYTGDYAFEAYSGGWKVEIVAKDLLPTYSWSHLVAVCDGQAGTAKLYRNGTLVGEGRCMAISNGQGQVFIGKGEEDEKSGPFYLNTFNGLVDELEAFDTLLSENDIKVYQAENPADLSIPRSRFSGQRQRPVFHGMPAANWTNESHGMLYSGGKFHLFFQKNANGPYMSRLHWGHLSSENLYDWNEEKIAIMPGEAYDMKGCWSGHVFVDPTVGEGKPTAIYTGVDYVRAYIASATAGDADLSEWTKNTSNPIINGKPAGLSDDFRDPFFFRSGDKAFIIVGSSKNGVGTTTLHEYNPTSGTWSNDGRLFFTGTDSESCGTFWEMPNVTKMENGKWLFTCTPLNTKNGVRTLYWTGDISSDGTFIPDAQSKEPRGVELISKEGYGLLSPTIIKHEDKIIALGIVPDKLSGTDNYNLGWAHTYSFPREWSIGKDGALSQKPFEGLKDLRSAKLHQSFENHDLNGAVSFDGVSGTRMEVCGEFEVGNSPFGWRLLKNASGAAEISYNPASNQLTVDLTSVNKMPNDTRIYNGIYQAVLPERPAMGSVMKINVFLDGSILDIFVNDRWATSIRVFPTDNDANGVEVFGEGSTRLVKGDAWVLESDAHPASVDSPVCDFPIDEKYYDLQGRQLTAPDPGQIYIAGNRKFVNR